MKINNCDSRLDYQHDKKMIDITEVLAVARGKLIVAFT